MAPINPSGPFKVRFRSSLGGFILPDGKMRTYRLEDVAGARARALLAEDILHHSVHLEGLAGPDGDHGHLAVVRGYLEQELEVDMAIIDPARFKGTIRGVSLYCRLGLHRQAGDRGGRPQRALQPVESFFIDHFEHPAPIDSVAGLISKYLATDFDPDLALINPEQFQALLAGILNFCCNGFHRLVPIDRPKRC